MLEDSRMDKKSINRSTQPQSRASAVDCKKNSELTVKCGPRYNKKREGSSSTPKNEPIRKNLPVQRGKGQIDRRPRARGSTGFMGGAENTRIAEDEPELGSVFIPGSKKQNLSHLLNFTYTQHGVPERRGPVSRRYTQQQSVRRHPHNQDLYLQACCQFVVKEDGDYKANFLDPDVPVCWDQVQEILVRSTGKSECPICLGTPVAGRVGRCGHVHCWPCALHYTAAHDKQPPPCPVCSAPFIVEQMKPARIIQWESPAEHVKMRLVRRVRGSTMVELAPARGVVTEDTVSALLPLDQINDAPYAKLFSANKLQILDILKRDRKEIQNQILNEIDTTEIVFMEQALEMIKVKEEQLNSDTEIEKLKAQAEIPIVGEDKQQDDAPTVYEKQIVYEKKIDWFVEAEGASCMEEIQSQINEMSCSNSEYPTKTELNPNAAVFEMDTNLNEMVEFPLVEDSTPESETLEDQDDISELDRTNQSKYFYFYQAEDGQQVFLHSLNVRILTDSWGLLSAAPLVINGRVLHREAFSVVETSRKHMPYAAHLPLHCPFDIVEMELQPPYVTREAISKHAEALESRARVRARNERDEKRRERACRRALEGPPKPHFSSADFPLPSPPMYCSPSAVDPVLPPVEVSPSASSTSSANVNASPSGLSFAKMAGSSGTWRIRASQARPPTPPPGDDEEGGAPRAVSLSDAISAALNARADSAAPAPAKGKKKKTKQKVLFAMGMQRPAD